MGKLGEGIKSAKAATAKSGKIAKVNAAKAVTKSKDTARRSVESSRQLASKAAEKSGQAVNNNPIAMVIGGLAVGAIIGALLPKTDRETKVLGGAGKRINKKVKQAGEAAIKVATQKRDELGLGEDALKDQFRELVGKASEAVRAATKAAGDNFRSQD